MDLTTAFREDLKDFRGLLGAYFEDLADGESVGLNADVAFPGASVIKVPVLVEIMRRAELGELSLAQSVDLPLNEDRFRTVDSSGILTHLTSPVKLSLLDLCTLMILESDNVAANALYDLAAPGANRTLEALGLSQTRLTHPIVDFPRLRQDDANPVTPREIGKLYTLIHRRELPGSAQMFDLLKEQHSEMLIPRLLLDETGLICAHKSGSVNGALHDGGLLHSPRWGCVLCLFTKNIVSRVQAGAVIAQLARRVYDYMQEKHPA